MVRMALGLLAVLLLGLTSGCGDQGADETTAPDPAATAGSTHTATPGPTTTPPAAAPEETAPPSSTVPPADTAPPTTVPETPPPSSTVPPLSAVPPPTLPQPARPPLNPSDQFKPVTVTGQVAVSGDCVNLVTSTVRWTLLLGPAAPTLQHGATVEITGLPSPQLQTPCGDAPLQVYEVRPR